jgi:NAD(P)-dependent dehydrogenase (short-subunit alcohol dehydrogenase family)
MRLAGKTAVITGAAGDIGKATSRRFHAEGARLALIDRDSDGLEVLARSFEKPPLSFVADVTDEDQIRQTAEAIRSRIGQIDILFINAGIEQSHASVVDMEKEAFERVVAVNLTGGFLTAKHFLPVVADYGSVVFTSSIAAVVAFPGSPAYSASKAGLIGLMRSAALDVAQRRIRCNTILPGPVKSKMLARAAQQATGGSDMEEWYQAMSEMARMGRLVEPDDVASLALFLASDESAMISSQSIAVDGGLV